MACLGWRGWQVAEPGFELQSHDRPRVNGRSPERKQGSCWAPSLVPKGSVFTPCSMPACPLALVWVDPQATLALWSLKVSECEEVRGGHLVTTRQWA